MSILLQLKSLVTAPSGPTLRNTLITDAITIEAEANRVAAKVDPQHNTDGTHGPVTATSVSAPSMTLGGVQRNTWPAAGSATVGLTDVLANGNIGNLPVGATDFEIKDDTGLISLFRINKATRAIFGALPQYEGKKRAQAIHVTYAASGSSGFQVADNAALNMGTSDFGYHGLVVALPDYTPAAQVFLQHKHDGTNGVIFTLETNGLLRLQINATTYDSTVATGLEDSTVANLSYTVLRSTASVAGEVRFFANGNQIGNAVAIAAGAPVTVSNTSTLYIMGNASARMACTLYSGGGFYNLKLSPAEERLRYLNGAMPEHRNSTQTILNVSACTSTNNAYTTFTGASATGFTAADAAPANNKNAGTADEISFVQGMEYEVKFTATLTSGGVPTVWAQISQGSGSYISYTLPNGGSVSTLAVANGDNVFRFYANQTTVGVINFSTAMQATSYSIANIATKRVGETINLNAIQPNQIHDSGASDCHAAFPAAGTALAQFQDSGQYNFVATVSADTTFVLPANYMLESMLPDNQTANSADLRIGTTAGGVDVLAATTAGASKLTPIQVNYAFSRSADKTLYLSSALWGGASYKVTLYFRRIS